MAMRKEAPFTRRRFLETAGTAAALMPWMLRSDKGRSMQSLGSNPETHPRNVIFVLSDDHRYDFMSFMGKPKFLKTPNMDRMASNGAHLANAFVSTALCSPSRASILTGQYAHKHGVVDNNTNIPEGTVFFPSYLQQVGYQTAFFGKWHMGSDTDEPRPGFDKWVSFRGQGIYYNPTLNIDGRREKIEGYVTDLLTDYALNWLDKERNPAKPYFLYLSHKAVHAMFEPAKRHEGQYTKAEIEYPAGMGDTEGNYNGKPAWVKAQRNSWHGVDYLYHGEIEFDGFYRRYCETLLALDESIGSILDYLKRTKELDRTLVIYMGDNGFCLGEHGLIDKRQMYEESMRVPLLAHCPELIRPGTVVQPMVQNIDIAPTVLEAAGLEPPAHMDGRSFLPLLEGKTTAWRDAVFYEYYWERNFPQTPTVHGVRTGRYKYMHYHGIWDIDEFYDLKNDPNEMENLIASPEHQTRIGDFNKRVFDWLERTGGLFIPLRRDAGVQMNKRRP